MSDQLVIASFKNSPTPTFTKACTLDELLVSIESRIPVDKVFLLVPHPDGKGYSSREVGRILVDIIRDDISISPTPSVPPIHESIQNQPQTPIVPSEPSPPQQQTFQFGEEDEDRGFHFEKPRPQAELLKERGLEQPTTKPKKKSKVKSKVSTKDVTEEELAALPHVRSNSTRRVNRIKQATAAESAAATQFGKI